MLSTETEEPEYVTVLHHIASATNVDEIER